MTIGGRGLSCLGNSRSPAGLSALPLSGFLSQSGGRAETRAPSALALHGGQQARQGPVCPLRSVKATTHGSGRADGSPGKTQAFQLKLSYFLLPE